MILDDIRMLGGKMRRAFSTRIHARSKKKQLEGFFDRGFPEQLKTAAIYLATGKMDQAAESVAQLVESRRNAIAQQGDKRAEIWYSPKPGSAGESVASVSRPTPGKTLEFTMRRIAATGKNKRWGIVLHLIAREAQSATIVELGACAGLSAMYLASAPRVQRLITVEGSKALSEIAKQSLGSFNSATVVNSLFDDAIDSELPGLGPIVDYAYIDGHHEKLATIYYFERLLPFLRGGAIVVFDDISWSYDMREAWEVLVTRDEFDHVVDFGSIGVCILKAERTGRKPQQWDLRSIVGKTGIGTPSGWNE